MTFLLDSIKTDIFQDIEAQSLSYKKTKGDSGKEWNEMQEIQ